MICAVNKVDRLDRAETAAVLAEAAELEVVDEVFPISREAGDGGRAAGRRASPSSCPRGRCSIRPRSAPTSRARSTSPS